MTERRRPHGARPRMSAALRRAFEAHLAEREEGAPGDWLVSVGIEPADAEHVVDRLYDHFTACGNTRARHPLGDAMRAVESAYDDGKDPDGKPLLNALVALPDGQRATFLAMIDMACALAAAEGMALGALYVAYELEGRRERGRSRPRR